MIAWPSLSAVLKQFRACSVEVPGMAVVMAFTTSCSVCLSLCSKSTLRWQPLSFGAVWGCLKELPFNAK